MSSPQAPATSTASEGDSSMMPSAPAAAPPPTVSLAWISFHGDGPADTFIQAIQRFAFSQDRVEDDKWIAQYASTCFSSSAMGWYLDLDEAVQSSWVKLRAALAKQYPVPDTAQSKSGQYPVSPLPPISSPPLAVSPTSTFDPRDIGVVLVRRPGQENDIGYLSQSPKGRVIIGSSFERAIKFQRVFRKELDSSRSTRLYCLKMLNSSSPHLPFLGLKLVKLSDEDPSDIPEWDPEEVPWKYIQDLPHCCKGAKGFPNRQLGEGYSFKKATSFATWTFTRLPEGEEEPAEP
ncbi:hypothetical protein FRB90_000911 [Tulasnella sp. 427]|nr:hypothetical protein FRB90_000911 [Tulasnella sp. 427]